MRSTWVGIGLVAVSAAMGLVSCGDDGGTGTATGSTAVQLTATNYVTIPPTQSTAAPPVTTSGPQPEQEYIIEEGDLPVTIARKFNVPFQSLLDLNEWVLEGQFVTNFPPVGTTIRIPAGGTLPGETVPPTTAAAGVTPTATAPVFTAAPTTTAKDCPTTDYTVVSGDYPLKVANDHGVELAALNAVNANTPGYRGFAVGTVIKIPASDDC